MEKEEIRKEFFKLRVRHHSYSQCRKLLKALFGYEVTLRTLKRWTRKLNETEWDLKDKSRRPKTLHYKVTPEIEKKVIKLREKTGWGSGKISAFIDEISEVTIKRIISKRCLNSRRKYKKRIKYIRFQREHPNSMWQADIGDQKIKGRFCLSIVDDCTRYSLGLIPLKRASTESVVHALDKLIEIHGKPREILTDNGACFGLRNKHSKFDRWCKRRGILHIRTSIHSPTTTGKVERLFQTMVKETPFCNNDPELFRLRYNHLRPHISLRGKTPAEVYFDFSKLF